MTNEGNDMKGYGKKKRKRKRSQKQIERWVKYREKKKLEKMNFNLAAVSGYHGAAPLASSVTTFSTLRAEAPEFVPKSLGTSADLQHSSLSDVLFDTDYELFVANLVDFDESNDLIEETKGVIEEEDDIEDVFGILAIYSSSKLNAVTDKEICKTTDAAGTLGYLCFSPSNL